MLAVQPKSQLFEVAISRGSFLTHEQKHKNEQLLVSELHACQCIFLQICQYLKKSNFVSLRQSSKLGLGKIYFQNGVSLY